MLIFFWFLVWVGFFNFYCILAMWSIIWNLGSYLNLLFQQASCDTKAVGEVRPWGLTAWCRWSSGSSPGLLTRRGVGEGCFQTPQQDSAGTNLVEREKGHLLIGHQESFFGGRLGLTGSLLRHRVGLEVQDPPRASRDIFAWESGKARSGWMRVRLWLTTWSWSSLLPPRSVSGMRGMELYYTGLDFGLILSAPIGLSNLHISPATGLGYKRKKDNPRN